MDCTEYRRDAGGAAGSTDTCGNGRLVSLMMSWLRRLHWQNTTMASVTHRVIEDDTATATAMVKDDELSVTVPG